MAAADLCFRIREERAQSPRRPVAGKTLDVTSDAVHLMRVTALTGTEKG
jgi:hypothetical protein